MGETATPDLVDVHEVTEQPEPGAEAIAEEPEAFPREYVQKLRDEMAKYRQRARNADRLGQQLHTELVRATGRLADPTDLPFNDEHLTNPDTLAAAIDDLLARKPHLASRSRSAKSGKERRPRAVASTWPQSCGNERDRKRCGL